MQKVTWCSPAGADVVKSLVGGWAVKEELHVARCLTLPAPTQAVRVGHANSWKTSLELPLCGWSVVIMSSNSLSIGQCRVLLERHRSLVLFYSRDSSLGGWRLTTMIYPSWTTALSTIRCRSRVRQQLLEIISHFGQNVRYRLLTKPKITMDLANFGIH